MVGEIRRRPLEERSPRPSKAADHPVAVVLGEASCGPPGRMVAACRLALNQNDATARGQLVRRRSASHAAADHDDIADRHAAASRPIWQARMRVAAAKSWIAIASRGLWLPC